MTRANVMVKNEVGLHARPAVVLIQTAQKFKSDIRFLKNMQSYNGKSMISLLSMGAKKGDMLTVTAEGEDEVEAVNTLKSLIDSFKD